MPGEVVVSHDVAAETVHEEERRARPARLDRDEQGPGRRPLLLAKDRRERLHVGGLEDRCQRDLLTKDLFELREETHGEQRVPAEIEEVVARRRPADVEDLLPDQLELASRTRPWRREESPCPLRCASGRAAGGPSGPPCRCGASGSASSGTKSGRDHVVRQALREEFPQLRRFAERPPASARRRRRAGGRRNVLAGEHHGLAHAG